MDVERADLIEALQDRPDEASTACRAVLERAAEFPLPDLHPASTSTIVLKYSAVAERPEVVARMLGLAGALTELKVTPHERVRGLLIEEHGRGHDFLVLLTPNESAVVTVIGLPPSG